MKTNVRIWAVPKKKINLAEVILVLIITIFYTVPSKAQGHGHDGGRGNDHEKEHNNQSQGRRNDIVIDRPHRSEQQKNDEHPGNHVRNYDPASVNRERNDNRGYNSDRNSGRRNDFPANDSRRENGNWQRDRRDNDHIERERNSNRYNIYTRERPGYRPVYHYDSRPVYNRYDPCWRYNFLPRRNSFFYNLPSSYFSISFGGFSYRYWDGVFYRPYNNLFTVCAPPIGIYISALPAGYSSIYVRDYPYYYYNGTYYDRRGSNYYVVSPPVGAIVESIPDGYETLVIDGETYYVVDGAQYKPVVQENGEIWYEVIKAN